MLAIRQKFESQRRTQKSPLFFKLSLPPPPTNSFSFSVKTYKNKRKISFIPSLLREKALYFCNLAVRLLRTRLKIRSFSIPSIKIPPLVHRDLLMSSPPRRLMVQHPVVVDVGCGCRRSIFSSLLSASSSSSYSLKERTSKPVSSSSPSDTTYSPAGTISLFSSSPSPAKQVTSGQKREKKSRAVKRRKSKRRHGVVEDSVAVLKESLNPYFDFYESMLVMVTEQEMYGWEDLCELLHQYLSLNSSCHHHIILRAFADVWNNVFSPAAAELPGGSTATTGSELIPRPESLG